MANDGKLYYQNNLVRPEEPTPTIASVSNVYCGKDGSKHFESPKGDPKFLKMLDEMRAVHIKKSTDYGSGEDPLANLRDSQELGVAPWVGCAIRLNDKVKRIKSFLRNGKLANESIEDNLMDIANYALLALLLYREENSEPPAMGG